MWEGITSDWASIPLFIKWNKKKFDVKVIARKVLEQMGYSLYNAHCYGRKHSVSGRYDHKSRVVLLPGGRQWLME